MTLSQSIQISLCFSITVVYDAKVGKKNEKHFDPSQIPPSVHNMTISAIATQALRR